MRRFVAFQRRRSGPVRARSSPGSLFGLPAIPDPTRPSSGCLGAVRRDYRGVAHGMRAVVRPGSAAAGTDRPPSLSALVERAGPWENAASLTDTEPRAGRITPRTTILPC